MYVTLMFIRRRLLECVNTEFMNETGFFKNGTALPIIKNTRTL